MRHARDDYQGFTTNGTSRLIPADEPVFLLRAQDKFAAATVRHWADLAEAGGADPEIIAVARKHADAMDAWEVKKVPDLPDTEAKAVEEVAVTVQPPLMSPEPWKPLTIIRESDVLSAYARTFYLINGRLPGAKTGVVAFEMGEGAKARLTLEFLVSDVEMLTMEEASYRRERMPKPVPSEGLDPLKGVLAALEGTELEWGGMDHENRVIIMEEVKRILRAYGIHVQDVQLVDPETVEGAFEDEVPLSEGAAAGAKPVAFSEEVPVHASTAAEQAGEVQHVADQMHPGDPRRAAAEALVDAITSDQSCGT